LGEKGNFESLRGKNEKSHLATLHIEPIPNSTAETVIMELGKIFAIWGYPAKLVADNGLPFQSIAYKDFCTRCNIICCIISAYSPESNGFGEKSVDTAKKAMKKLMHDLEAKSTVISDFHLRSCVNRFLFNDRNKPSTVTGKTPNELLLFRPRTELSKLLPQSQTD